MPYSHALGLVHVAIPKTGSTSVIRAINGLLQPDEEAVNLHHGRVGKHFFERHGVPREGLGRWPRRRKHLSARQLKAILGDEFDEMFSFSLTRNPWARALSKYRFNHASSKPDEAEMKKRRPLRTFPDRPFADWVRQKLARAEVGKPIRAQLDRLVDEDGEILVDFVGKLENLQADFATVCERIGRPAAQVQHVNWTSRSHYSQFYDDWSRDAVAALYQRDIEAFDYEFETP